MHSVCSVIFECALYSISGKFEMSAELGQKRAYSTDIRIVAKFQMENPGEIFITRKACTNKFDHAP